MAAVFARRSRLADDAVYALQRRCVCLASGGTHVFDNDVLGNAQVGRDAGIDRRVVNAARK